MSADAKGFRPVFGVRTKTSYKNDPTVFDDDRPGVCVVVFVRAARVKIAQWDYHGVRREEKSESEPTDREKKKKTNAGGKQKKKRKREKKKNPPRIIIL